MSERYGSVSRVLTVSDENLHSALNRFPAAARAVCSARRLIAVGLEQQLLGEPVSAADERLLTYLKHELVNPDEERMFAVFLDANCRYLHGECIARGSRSSVNLTTRAVVQRSLDLGADAVLLAHNHPSGSCIPSDADRDTTSRVERVLQAIEITLIDHLVLGTDGTYSIRGRRAL